jgi:hypothetical protein
MSPGPLIDYKQLRRINRRAARDAGLDGTGSCPVDVCRQNSAGGLVRGKDILDIERRAPGTFWLIVFLEGPFTGRLLDGVAEARKVVCRKCDIASTKRYRWIDIFHFRCQPASRRATGWPLAWAE